MVDVYADHDLGYRGSTFIICEGVPTSVSPPDASHRIRGHMPTLVGPARPVTEGQTLLGRVGAHTILFRVEEIYWESEDSPDFTADAIPLQRWDIKTGELMWKSDEKKVDDLMDLIDEMEQEDADRKFWAFVACFVVAALVTIWFMA